MCWPARWWWAPCWCGSRPSNWSIAEVKLSVPLSTPYLFQTSKRNLHMSTIGFIGLGAMGSGMAASLRRAGHELQVFDVRREVADAFAAQGGRACGSPAEAAKGADVVVSVVVNAAQTEAVLFGADGQGGCAQAMSPGAVFVMCSTVDPNWSAALETRLEAMAAKVYRLGERAGAGSKVKIINQLLAGVHIAAAAEAMALGLREGVEAKALYEVITHSAGNSWMFENRMAHVLAADYTPLSAVDIFVKDLGLVLDTARASKFPLPLSSTAHQMFMQASTAGFGREDDSAVIKIFPGITLPGAE